MERQFIVTESELRELIHDSMIYCALQDNGVDNWDGYKGAINAFIIANAQSNEEDDYDIAERILNEDYVEYK